MARPKAALSRPAVPALAPKSVLISTVRKGREKAPSRLIARAATSSHTVRGMAPPFA
ncbi:hypothetical protein [Streptomyces cirratus]|uniref:hypothetical protein n=1 Tax=Streptomyces cirratus TaxID=68187 RepID=UPI0036189ED4